MQLVALVISRGRARCPSKAALSVVLYRGSKSDTFCPAARQNVLSMESLESDQDLVCSVPHVGLAGAHAAWCETISGTVIGSSEVTIPRSRLAHASSAVRFSLSYACRL